MKLYRNNNVYAVTEISPKEKFAKTEQGKKVISKQGGLHYLWQNDLVFPGSKFGPMAKREYKNHQNGHGIQIIVCKICKTEFTNIESRGKTPTRCKACRYTKKKKE